MALFSKLLQVVAAFAVVSVRAHPVEKVIGLLEELEATAVKEGKDEEVAYNKFEHWCATSQKDLNTAIAEEKENEERLSVEISGHKKNIEVLDKDIASLTQELLEQDQLAAEALNERKAGSALYEEEKTSLEQTIKAMADGIAILSDTKKNTDSGLVQARSRVRSLLALVGFRASASQRDLLSAFAEVQQRPELQAAGDRGAHVKQYEFKSDSVVELLKQLKLSFEDQLVTANKEETNAINAYDLAKVARDNLVDAKIDAKATKEKEVSDTRSSLESASAALASTREDFQADSSTLSATETSCRSKKSEWEERSETRKLEVQAIEMAITILAKATGVRSEAPSNPVPPPSPVALLQVSSSAPLSELAVHILRVEAKKVHSQALGRIADDVETRVKHGDGHFDQVVNAIEKMIHHLMSEQTEENDHKNWCDQEISKTQTSIKDKHEKVNELTLKIEDAQARAAKLLEDVRAADEMVSKISNHMQQASEIREIGKKENKLAMKDAEEAQTAIANAVAVLKDFYKKSGGMKKEDFEFLQAPVALPENPSTWDSGYTGVADPAAQPNGIVAVLEKVASDFAQMQSQTMAQEQSDQEAYEQEIKSCEIEQARRREESKQKQAEAERTVEEQRSLEATRKSVAGELDATRQYEKDLVPACVDGGSTYEDRKAARTGEIAALKEAQGLLKNAFESKTDGAKEAPKFLQRRVSTAGMLRTDE